MLPFAEFADLDYFHTMPSRFGFLTVSLLEIVRLTHLTRLRTISVFPYSTGIELVFQHKLLKSLWSKNAVKMMHGTKNLDIKIFGNGH